MSPYHFHRLFKAVTGVTPKAWQQAFRARRLRETLANSETITDAVLAAGVNQTGQDAPPRRKARAAIPSAASAFR